jgi:hypothetical protein
VAEITEAGVERIEKLANLKLPAERRHGVADILNVWVPAANELSAKMAESRYRGLTPNVRFAHPGTEEVIEP